MTGHQCHLWEISHIPCIHDQPAAVRVLFDLVNQVTDLVNYLTIFPFPATPLFSINGAKLTFLISPFIPDADIMFAEVGYIGFSFEKPEQFIDNTFQVNFFRGHQGESFLKIKSHLVTKITLRTSTSTVAFMNSMIKYMA